MTATILVPAVILLAASAGFCLEVVTNRDYVPGRDVKFVWFAATWLWPYVLIQLLHATYGTFTTMLVSAVPSVSCILAYFAAVDRCPGRSAPPRREHGGESPR